jgi:hypothetical protein
MWEIVHLVGFYYNNISWSTVLWMSNSPTRMFVKWQKIRSNLQKYIYVIIQLCSILIYAKTPDYRFVFNRSRSATGLREEIFISKYVLYVLLSSATLKHLHIIKHGTFITKDALSITEQKKEMDCTTPSLLFSINPPLQCGKICFIISAAWCTKSSWSKVILA